MAAEGKKAFSGSPLRRKAISRAFYQWLRGWRRSLRRATVAATFCHRTGQFSARLSQKMHSDGALFLQKLFPAGGVCGIKSVLSLNNTEIEKTNLWQNHRNLTKYVYLFGNKKADGNGSMKPLLGGKGANLAEMTRIGLPVPPGFTITTEVCTYYLRQQADLSEGAPGARSRPALPIIEKIMGTKFGDKTEMPLLVAVRSGARDSMPGMMDTILNLGLNDADRRRLVAKPRRTSVSPGTATAASSRCMATSSWASRSAPGRRPRSL